jgi:hypothetical protein
LSKFALCNLRKVVTCFPQLRHWAKVRAAIQHYPPVAINVSSGAKVTPLGPVPREMIRGR